MIFGELVRSEILPDHSSTINAGLGEVFRLNAFRVAQVVLFSWRLHLHGEAAQAPLHS